MRFPFVVVPELTDRQVDRFYTHMDSDRSGWHRRWTESIWRRHQDPANALLSGWKSENDRRRRLIHFYDEYGVDGRQFVLRGTYVWVNVTLPDAEIERYRSTILSGLETGGWERASASGTSGQWSRGDLDAKLDIVHRAAADEQRGVNYPPDYRNLTLTLKTRDYEVPDGLDGRPWVWFHDIGMRPTLETGKPLYIEPEELEQIFPAQVELGCGPSTEAGVPHLSNLHRIYGVSKSDFGFVFDPDDDGLLDVLARPEEKISEMTDIYRACVLAEPTPFYKILRELADRGDIVGPIITNNFDCLCADMGFPEISLRRYDTEAYFPMTDRALAEAIEFDPRAKSLLVVGVHADRRLAQMRARECGLTVAYIDPELYVDPSGDEINYPVEAPGDDDLFVRLKASDAFTRLSQQIGLAQSGSRTRSTVRHTSHADAQVQPIR